VPDGCQVAIFCHGICRKANTASRAKKLLLSSTGSRTLHNVLLWSSIKSGINIIPENSAHKHIMQSSHCLYLPFLPTPHTFLAVASSSLLVPRNFTTFTAPTAANKPRSSAYQLLRPTALSRCTRIQAGE
jgi:hypothetical protein